MDAVNPRKKKKKYESAETKNTNKKKPQRYTYTTFPMEFLFVIHTPPPLTCLLFS